MLSFISEVLNNVIFANAQDWIATSIVLLNLLGQRGREYDGQTANTSLELSNWRTKNRFETIYIVVFHYASEEILKLQQNFQPIFCATLC